MDTDLDYRRRNRGGISSKHQSQGGRWGAAERQRHFGDFKCLHCNLTVAAEPMLAGVRNRNHCPYCLWSKHVDLHEAGDRLCACKGAMRPVGVTVKRLHKKYVGPASAGELMLVHQCAGCGALSLNRIAADDYSDGIWEVYQESLPQEPALRALAERDGIELLGEGDRAIVWARLFGRSEWAEKT